jgi:hypothetical protein
MAVAVQRRLLYSYETGLPLRELVADEWQTYQALLDAYTPAAKEHGVVEGQFFGETGLVFARAEDEDAPRQVLLSLAPEACERLQSLAAANGLTESRVVQFLVMAHPRQAPIDPHAPFEPAGHLEIKP